MLHGSWISPSLALMLASEESPMTQRLAGFCLCPDTRSDGDNPLIHVLTVQS